MPNIYLRPVIAIPSALEITAITQAMPMVVTGLPNSDQENVYIPGMLVKLNIPSSYGMQQAAGLTLQILSVSGLNFSLDIDSSKFDPFVVPAITKERPANMTPAGSKNLQFGNNTKQVAFQSLNNQGN